MNQEQRGRDSATPESETVSGYSESSQSIKRTIIYSLLLAVSIGFLVGGYFVENRPLLAHLFNELGIAGVVAFILALTIERLSAEEFRRRAERERKALREEFAQQREAIKNDVFYEVFGHTLPEKLKDELFDVWRTDFIRSKFYLEFQLSIVKDPLTAKEYVKSKCRTRSKIQNITRQKKVFSLDHAIDQSPIVELKNEVKYLEFQVSGCETEFLLKEADLRNLIRIEEDQVVLDLTKDRVNRQIVVLPGDEQQTEMRIEYQAIREEKGPGIYYSFTSHTCDLELTVIVQSEDLKVFAETPSSNPLKPTDRHNPAGGYYNWVVEKAFLRHQAVHVSWRRPAALPKPAAVPQAAAAATPVTSSAAGGSGSPTVPAAQPKSDPGNG